MAALTVYEQLLLELVNRARLDPAAEAARYGIALNKGLAAGSLTAGAKQALAPNELLVSSARAHSQWMIDTDIFSHTGVGGTDPGDRMGAAGYAFTGSWTWGENIAWSGTTGTPELLTYTNDLHRNLFLSPGHRINILEGDFRELGTGIASGPFRSGTTTYNAVMASENFATSGSSFFVTGVAITDRDGDNFYDIGEARSGITMSLSSSGSDTTGAAGGFAAQFAGGTVGVTFSGGDLPGTVSVTIAAGLQNAKVDLVDTNEILSSVSTTLGAGAVKLGLLGVASLRGTGNDVANVICGNRGSNSLDGQGGDDYLFGGAGRDFLTGGAGADKFDFNAVRESGKTATLRDQITDFLRGADKLDLSSIDARTTLTGNQAFKWIATQAFHHKAGELHFVRSGANILVEGDVNGDAVADFQIQVNGISALAAADFVL
jgi:Ca2+-binding RTX toxin-like protein